MQVIHLIRRFLSQPLKNDAEPPRNEKRPATIIKKENSGMTEWEEPSTLDDMDPSLIVELAVETKEEDRNLKATKSDDAEIPYHLWNDRILSKFKPQAFSDVQEMIKALDSIRKGALRYWKRNIASDFWSW